eukprot:gnl/MRDRNA2_/MRDRNA2_233037_c0_seq1.p1 gnl/MRDRNA2_/MRDRNA2_233037_c0~~gnl/MRDRNA2_/MRDRNA2_233037_c0_seq1.p1  ORF type:complete len:328 (+),score=50.29 gnl/MRDRNA2_/MRDRNA2_233037_c0_seq1:78-986(+)
MALKDVVEESKKLQKYAEERAKILKLQISPQKMDGTVCPVEVFPASDTVLVVKQKIAAQYGLHACNLKLCINGGVAVMNNKDLLMTYDLAAGITLIVFDDIIPNQLLRLSFSDPHDLGYDTVSDSSGTFVHPRHKQALEVHGRQGIDFRGKCVLRLTQPFELKHEWTISFWMLLPLSAGGGMYYRELMDGIDTWHEPVLIANHRIGGYDDINGYAETNFDVTTLADGWHHVVAVGREAEGTTNYFVDGKLVGSTHVHYKGPVGCVGNRHDAAVNDAFGVVSDLRVFGVAATEEQIERLAMVD